MTYQGEEKVECHWTYRTVKPEEDLRQGDVIRAIPGLTPLLREKHPEYQQAGNTYFIVLTQSCDLVRRGKKPCNSSSIVLSPVWPLRTVIMDHIAHSQTWLEELAGVCRQSVQADLRLFLERLVNNNEPEFFYLHTDADIGIPEPSCARIRLSIALDARRDYKLLTNHRVVGLNDSFAHKLGWHVGWLYARVGTEDWVPDHLSESEFSEMISRLFEDVYPWALDAKIKEATSLLVKNEAQYYGLFESADDLREFIEIMPGKSFRERVLDAIEQALFRDPIFDESGIVGRVHAILSDDDRMKEAPPKDKKRWLNSAVGRLREQGISVQDLIIQRITDLLSGDQQILDHPEKEAMIQNLKMELSKISLLDDRDVAKKLFSRIRGNAAFKSALNEAKP